MQREIKYDEKYVNSLIEKVRTLENEKKELQNKINYLRQHQSNNIGGRENY